MFCLRIYAMLAMSRQTLYALSICLAAVGIAAFFLMVREIVRTVIFLRSSHRTDGKVVRFEARRNSEGSQKHRAVVSFAASDGSVHEIQAKVAHSPPAPAAATTITVRYLPGDPQNAKIENFWEIWETALFYFVIFSVMFLFVSILMIIAPYS